MVTYVEFTMFLKALLKSPLLKDGFWIVFHHGKLALTGLHLGVDFSGYPSQMCRFFLRFY